MSKWFFRASTIASILLTVGCTNGKYDPTKADKIGDTVGQYTGATPTTNPTAFLVSAAVPQVPYGAAIFGLVNAGLLIMHEYNARQRSKDTSPVVPPVKAA